MKHPQYIGIAAITIDGKIAKNKSHMSDWTSKEDKVFMRALLDRSDVVIVGNNTYKTAIKPLSRRNCLVLSRSEHRKVGASENLNYVNPDKTDVKKYIRDRKYKTVAILGGAQTYTHCLEHNMLDELYLTVEPLAFGEGINLFAKGQNLEQRFKLLSIKKLNRQGSLLLRYKKS
jgi:dihydrofolate reductase